MDDIIQKKHITQPTVIQTAEKSVYIESKENATVNLTINMPQGTQIGMFSSNGTTNDGKPSIQGLSHEYYNLIVLTIPILNFQRMLRGLAFPDHHTILKFGFPMK